MHARVHTHTHGRTCTRVCIHACSHACAQDAHVLSTRVHMHAHMHMRAHTHTNTRAHTHIPFSQLEPDKRQAAQVTDKTADMSSGETVPGVPPSDPQLSWF